MKIDKKTVEHLEALSRIELTSEERARLTAQLDQIVAYVEQLQEVDTEGVEPTSCVVESGSTSLRADEPRPSLERDVILREAPDPHSPFFRVPKIIER